MCDLTLLKSVNRLLFTVVLETVQGDRFQPTGFPNLGAATYQAKDGTRLLVESAQSMANRLETTCWDATGKKPIAALDGISHVTVTRNGKFLTDSMLEAHRLNSPYLLKNRDRKFLDPFLADLRQRLGEDVVDNNQGEISRRSLAQVILKYDIGSLIHGLFFGQKGVILSPGTQGSSIAGGRLRVARALSAFIEARGVRVAASGGVKNDHVNPSGVTEDGFGNVPFPRDEFTAESIDCYVNLDLAQIRGYGLDEKVERLLILLALHRLRRLLDGDLRLRTACDLEPVNPEKITAARPADFDLPGLTELEEELPNAIADCAEQMTHTTVAFEDELKKGKNADSTASSSSDDDGDNSDDVDNEQE